VAKLEDAVPFALLSWLPKDTKVLPDRYERPVFHYTSLVGAHGIIASDAVFASHIGDLNDPSERLFGWSVIQERFRATRDRYTPELQERIAAVCERAVTPGDRFAQAFVLSASTEPDNLTQFRLYGQCHVELAGGIWTAGRTEDAEQRLALQAVWREVIYGAEGAHPFVDAMLGAVATEFASRTESTNFEDAELYSWMEILEILALHIKDAAYKDEHEARLVFSLRQRDYMEAAHVRPRGDRLVTYLEAVPHDLIGLSTVKSVRLGPLAGGARSAEALRVHHHRHAPPTARSPHVDRGSLLHVEVSDVRYRE